MKVYVKSVGMIGRYLGTEAREVELPDDATLADFLDYFGQNLVSEVPAYLWNENKGDFRGPVIITINGEVAQDRETPIRDGQELVLFKPVVGG
jgi:sulfur carrier protein ThiS